MQFAALAWACAAITVPATAIGQEAQVARPVEIRTAECPRPEYPRRALREEVDGRTLVVLTVDEAGNVSDVQVERKSGDTALHALLDAEAVRVTQACRFPQATGFAPARVRLPYLWRLQ
jgi:protein TonB